MFRPHDGRLVAALSETLAHAKGAPFYRRRVPRSISRYADFVAAVPLLNKEHAAAQQERLRVAGVRPPDAMLAAGVLSSATTRTGRPLRILRSPDAYADAPPDTSPDDVPRKRAKTQVLRMYSPRHGVQLADRDDQVLLPVTLHPNTVDVLLELLDKRRTPRVTAMVAPVSALKWITIALLERARAGEKSASSVFNGFALRGVGTTGYPLTAHARSFLQRHWGAPLFDNYSLSELEGYAFECTSCGHQHWDGAPAHFECIDPLTMTPTRANWGELVVTTIVPHGLLMPLLRYRTGDLVARGPRCKRFKTRGVRFLGRVGHSLLKPKQNGRAQLVVGGRTLLEFGEANPDIAQVDHPAERAGVVPRSHIGVPKIRVHDGNVEVETSFRGDVYPDRHRALITRLRDHIRGQGGGRPKILTFSPGTLDLERWARKL